MKLAYQHIKALGDRLIKPFDLELCNPASYDITLDNVGIFNGDEITLPFTLRPGDFILVSSKQYWTFPADVGGQLLLKSTLGRHGVNHMLAGWFDPGFEGTATMELHNCSSKSFVLYEDMPVAQMVFDLLLSPTELSYSETGRYHGQNGVTSFRNKGKSGFVGSEPYNAGKMLSLL